MGVAAAARGAGGGGGVDDDDDDDDDDDNDDDNDDGNQKPSGGGIITNSRADRKRKSRGKTRNNDLSKFCQVLPMPNKESEVVHMCSLMPSKLHVMM